MHFHFLQVGIEPVNTETKAHHSVIVKSSWCRINWRSISVYRAGVY